MKTSIHCRSCTGSFKVLVTELLNLCQDPTREPSLLEELDDVTEWHSCFSVDASIGCARPWSGPVSAAMLLQYLTDHKSSGTV